MTTPVRIVLDGKPRGKERVKTAQHGHKYTPERTVTFESRLAFEAQHVMEGRALLDGALGVMLHAYMPVPASKARRWRPTRHRDARRARGRCQYTIRSGGGGSSDGRGCRYRRGR